MQFLCFLLIHGTPTQVLRGRLWSSRVVNAKLYKKYSDVDKARVSRNLEYLRTSEFARYDLKNVIEAARS